MRLRPFPTLALVIVAACGDATDMMPEPEPSVGPASQPAFTVTPFRLKCANNIAPIADAQPASLLELIAQYRSNPCLLSTSYGPLTAETVALYSTSPTIPEGVALDVGRPLNAYALEPGRYTVAPTQAALLDVKISGSPHTLHIGPASEPSTLVLRVPPAPQALAGGTLIMPDATSTLRRFSYVTGDPLDSRGGPSLAGMSGQDFARSRIERTLRTLRAEGVTLVVSLTENPPPTEWFDAYGIAHVLLPVKDFTAPSIEQLEHFVARVSEQGDKGRTVVHCGAGLGRTGTFLAAYFVARGESADEAIAHIRRMRPGSIETTTQEAAVAAFADALDDG